MINLVTNAVLVDGLIKSALGEDITSEDVSTNAIFKERAVGTVQLICKQDGVICGLPVFERVFKILDNSTEVKFYVEEGAPVKKGELIGELKGDMRVLLSGERNRDLHVRNSEAVEGRQDQTFGHPQDDAEHAHFRKVRGEGRRRVQSQI